MGPETYAATGMFRLRPDAYRMAENHHGDMNTATTALRAVKAFVSAAFSVVILGEHGN